MHTDNEYSPGSDAEVSAAYQSIATESVSTRLDTEVLRLATKEASPVWSLRHLYSLRRPIAFAATLVLSLGIVLQFDGLMENTVPDASSSEDVDSQGRPNQPMPAAVGGSDAMGPATDRYCGARQIETASLWWACILELDNEGQYEAAATERRLLRNTYPDFLPTK